MCRRLVRYTVQQWRQAQSFVILTGKLYFENLIQRMYTIQNNILSVVVKAKGAELDSLYHRQHGLEYLWSADPLYWAKKSPVLFPVVGTLKNDQYGFEGRVFHLGRHGFARDADFAVSEQSDTAISFMLESDAGTLEKFPFPFRFTIRYALQENSLGITFMVANTGRQPMYFSVGAHPAFKVPLEENTTYEDYFLEFESVENAGRWPISPAGLIEAVPVPLLSGSRVLPLTKRLFFNDALVFKHLASRQVTLKSNKGSHGLLFNFTGFPYLGIWAAKHADFVCIEPWCGIADSVNSSGQLENKEGINALEPGGMFERTYRVTLF